jgi:hypothetical protein
VSCQSGCWSQTSGLRIRPVPELKRCCVYVPASARLYWLDLNAWLSLELCDGSREELIVLRYVHAVCPPLLPRQARSECRLTIAKLAEIGMVVRHDHASSGDQHHVR